MTPDETKRRNYLIAGTVGGFLLPLAGLIGASTGSIRMPCAGCSPATTRRTSR